MNTTGADVTYRAGNRNMHGRLFTHPPQANASCNVRPGVLVFPEGFGLSEHTYREAQRIAELGYVAMACDLYGDGYFHNGPSQVTLERRDRVLAEIGLRGIGLSALTFLASRPEVDPRRIGACGYCLGATVAMELALRGEALVAVAGFHPSFHALSLDGPIRLSCPMHLFMGTLDYANAPQKRAPFESALKSVRDPSWRLTLYSGVKHSFTNPNLHGMEEACGYDREAHEHSFQGLTELFSSQFAAAR
jgi:dienelactone hydrolase